MEVSGWVSSPRVTRSHRQAMFFFVNGRLVQHRALQYALEEAYHSLIMVGRHPLTMVRIAVDPREVDVNVHPTKAEVKFADERPVARAVSRATHQALLQQTQDILPEVRFSDVVVAFAPGAMDAMLALALTLHIDPVFVGAHHLARFVFVSVATPGIVHLFDRPQVDADD